MNIRNAQPEDFERIMEIYAYARKFMAEHGNPKQWGETHWPPEDLVQSDIKTQHGYVCTVDEPSEDGSSVTERIVGVFFFNSGLRIEPTYDVIHDGTWKGSDTYGVVHRIASDGTVRGTGKYCINWALEKAGALRIDTHGDNVVMQNLLTSMGFEHCGTIYVEEDPYPRLAYEKILS